MTLKNLKKLVTKWQKMLMIQDMNIVASFESEAVLGEGILGRCHINTRRNYVEIQIIDDEDKILESGDTIESVLLHELVHVVIPHTEIGIPENHNHPKHVAFEKAIDKVTKIILSLK